MTDTVKVLSGNEVTEIQSTLERLAAPSEPWDSKTEKADTFQNVAARHALALCATVRALRADLQQAKKWQFSVEESEAAVCPEDVGFDEYIRHLEKKLTQAEETRDDLLNRSHQTVFFGCGCVFKQDGLDDEPRLITHCDHAALREQLAEAQIRIKELEDGSYV